jgi:hypothetical protein
MTSFEVKLLSRKSPDIDGVNAGGSTRNRRDFRPCQGRGGRVN